MKNLLILILLLLTTNCYAITWQKDWSAADNLVTAFGGADLQKIQDDIDSQILSSTSDVTFTGSNTFSGDNTFSGTVTISDLEQVSLQQTFNSSISITPSKMYIGNFTRDTTVATGTSSYTGIGFKPKAILFFVAQDASPEASWGLDNITSQTAIYDNDVASNGTYATSGTTSIFLYQQAGVISYIGEVSSFDVDGFTISWTKNGLATGTASVHYIAFGL